MLCVLKKTSLKVPVEEEFYVVYDLNAIED